MNDNRFLQVHSLTAFPPSLLNRDDAGLAKRISFGGVSRVRISSQCLKRHWRTAEDEFSLRNLGVEPSVRSRAIFEREIALPLEKEGFEREEIDSVLSVFMDNLLGKSAGKRRTATEQSEQEESKPGSLETSQPIVLGRPEINYIHELAKNILSRKGGGKEAEALFKDRDQKKNLQALKNSGAGLDASLFGRMVTSDLLARTDAAVHVAHAFTVHQEEVESDYFSVVDDLLAEDRDLGSAHIGETELSSGLFYGYLVFDLPLLVSNLEGVDRKDWGSADRSLAGRVVKHLVNLIATVSPGAKLGSTAPYSYAHTILAEIGNRQPRTLANAFLKPIDRSGEIERAALESLSAYLSAFDRMYGCRETRLVCSLAETPGLPAERAESIASLSEWVEARVSGR